MNPLTEVAGLLHRLKDAAGASRSSGRARRKPGRETPPPEPETPLERLRQQVQDKALLEDWMRYGNGAAYRRFQELAELEIKEGTDFLLAMPPAEFLAHGLQQKGIVLGARAIMLLVTKTIRRGRNAEVTLAQTAAAQTGPEPPAATRV